MKKALFVILGFLFFALGAVGAALPVLPTTPLLLLATACFAKGSTRFNNWFLKTRLYDKYVRDFAEHRSMTLKAKVCICAFASTMLVLAFFSIQNIYGRIAILGVIAFKYYYFIFRIKTVQTKPNAKGIRPYPK